jgi:hypothetical protein
MPFNSQSLGLVLTQMKAVFRADKVAAIRGQSFIKMLHTYCIEELKARNLEKPGLILSGETKILTSHKFKDMDVALIHPTSGPLLIICIRSQMSSLSKNFLNYYEMEVGDVSAIHERYPLCVVGLLYLHPARSIVEGKGGENFDFSRAEKMFKLISGREKSSDAAGHYEEIAYMKVDFEKDPPVLDRDFPTNQNLRLENFFDKLIEKFDERNFPLL